MTIDARTALIDRTKRRTSPISRQAARLLSLLLAAGMWPTTAALAGTERRFTVADDIALSHFGDPYTVSVEPITFSPDGRFLVVDTERGRIDLDRPESTLRVYRTADVAQFLRSPRRAKELAPLWIFTKSSYQNGPIITNIQWLGDSGGFAFLAKTPAGIDQLFLEDLPDEKNRHTSTSVDQHVTGFDIRDRHHYVYCVQSPRLRETARRESHTTAIAAKGHNIYGVVFGGNDDLHFAALAAHDLSEAVGCRRWQAIPGSRRLSE